MANRTGGGPVLFAYDGSEPSKASIREAAAHLSAGRDAIVLTVWEPLMALPFAGGAVMSPEVEEDFAERARNAADEGAGLAVSAGFKATPLAERGNPVWRTIVDAADEHDAGIVVMGSHGHTGIALVLMGSVAAAVTRHTERPVLIVHGRSDDAG